MTEPPSEGSLPGIPEQIYGPIYVGEWLGLENTQPSTALPETSCLPSTPVSHLEQDGKTLE